MQLLKAQYLHWDVHFYHSELQSASTLQSQRKVPELQIKFQENFKRDWLGTLIKIEEYDMICTLISSLVTPRSKLETYNFVPTSTPCIPAAFRLSSNKSCCHGKRLVLRIDWRRQTEPVPKGQKNTHKKIFTILQD